MSRLLTEKDGFIWMDVTEKSKEIFTSGLFELFALIRPSDDPETFSESLIVTYEDLDKHLTNGWTIAIEVGFNPFATPIGELTTKKFARLDSFTGQGMNKGYCINDGALYIEDHTSMLKHITNDTEYDTIEEAYEDGYYYYTEWDVEEEDYWYEQQEDGSWKEFDKDQEEDDDDDEEEEDLKYMCNCCHGHYPIEQMDIDEDNESDICVNCLSADNSVESITINILELASELASQELEYKYTDQIVIWQTDDNGDERYTDEAQTIFNNLYEKYCELIKSTKI